MSNKYLEKIAGHIVEVDRKDMGDIKRGIAKDVFKSFAKGGAVGGGAGAVVGALGALSNSHTRNLKSVVPAAVLSGLFGANLGSSINAIKDSPKIHRRQFAKLYNKGYDAAKNEG